MRIKIGDLTVVHSIECNGPDECRDVFSVYDLNGNMIYLKLSDGLETLKEYDAHGDITHIMTSAGRDTWFTPGGEEITEQEFDELGYQSCSINFANIVVSG